MPYGSNRCGGYGKDERMGQARFYRTVRWAVIFARGVAAFALAPALLLTLSTAPGGAQQPFDGSPYPDLRSVATPHDFDTLFERTVAAVQDAGLIPIARASASRAAEARGIDIPGNGVIDAFNNRFAVRLLSANVAAGFEAPIRLYLTEAPDGTVYLTYRPPSAIFAPYDDPAVDAIAADLDLVFADIVAAAVGG